MLRPPPALLIGCALLAGCSGEPSESEIRSAVEAHTRRAMGAAFTGFDAFRKQGCVDAKDAPGFTDCYYAATIPAQPGRKAMEVNGKGRFQRTERGLSFQDLGAQTR